MKKFLILLIILIFSTGKMIAQSTWEKIELPDSVKITQIYCLDENILFGFGYGNIYKTSDGGYNWVKVFSSKSKKFTGEIMSFINKNIGFSILGNDLYKTTDSGNSWFIVGAIPNSGDFIQRLLAIDEENIWILKNSIFWMSSDGGNSYQKVERYLSSSQYIEIGYSDGVGYAVDVISNVVTSTNKGKNWNFVSQLFSNEIISGIIVTYNDLYVHSSTEAIFGGNNNLIITEDGFKTISKNRLPPTIYSIRKKMAFADIKHGMIIFASEAGDQLYYTANSGQEWIQEFDREYMIFDVDGKDGVWYAIIYDNIIYKTSKNLNISTKTIAPIQIYPNPATDYFNIGSDDKQVEHIEIFDIAGRVVVSQNFPEHNKINIQTLANGFYIAKINMNNQIFQTKILKQ